MVGLWEPYFFYYKYTHSASDSGKLISQRWNFNLICAVHRLMWMYYLFLNLQYSCVECDFLYIFAGVAALWRTHKRTIIIFLSAILLHHQCSSWCRLFYLLFIQSIQRTSSFQMTCQWKRRHHKSIWSNWFFVKIKSWLLCIWAQSAQQPDVDIFHNFPNMLACDKQIKPHMYI